MASFGSTDRSIHVDIDINDQLNLIIRQSIVPISLWLGVLFTFFSISYIVILSKDLAIVMSLLAGLTACAFFSLFYMGRQRTIPSKWAHPIGVGMSSLVFLNSFVHMILTHDILQSTNLMLAFVAAGFFILSGRWFWFTMSCGVAGWLVATAYIPNSESKIHFVLGVFTSIVLSIIVHFTHVQSIKTLVKVRFDENRRRLELVTLNSIIVSITSSLESGRVFQEVVEAVRSLMPQINGATLQVLEGHDRFVTRAWSTNIEPEILAFYAGEGIAGSAVSERKMINVADVYSDPRFVTGVEKPDFRSLLAMPLIANETVVGVISVEASTVGAFGPEDERKIDALAGYAAVAIENARLYTEYAAAQETLKNYTEHLQEIVESRTSELRIAQDKIFEQKGLEQEIDLARQVQTSLLAQEIPQMDGYIFAATAIPARYVGGDFYDFIWKDDRCHIILADISGKGVSAAMLTSTARTLIRAAIKYENEPALILSNMQDAIYPDLSHAEMFGTFFAASLDPKTAVLTYANAGHTETIWLRHKNSSMERLPASGLPIGIIPNNEIVQNQILLCPGDVLIFYSDGITETFNPKNELFGLQRLMELVGTNRADSAHTLAQRILTEVDSFARGAPLADDLTLVVLKVMPRTMSFRMQIDLDRFDDAVRFIRQQVEPYGVDFAYQVELAVSELITNIAKHAFHERPGELRGEIVLQEDAVILDFYDDGESFDPARVGDVDFEQAHTSGYGMHIMRQIMNEVDYSSAGEKGMNHWRMVKSSQEMKTYER